MKLKEKMRQVKKMSSRFMLALSSVIQLVFLLASNTKFGEKLGKHPNKMYVFVHIRHLSVLTIILCQLLHLIADGEKRNTWQLSATTASPHVCFATDPESRCTLKHFFK